MRFSFILVQKAFYPVTMLCRVLMVSCSGLYAWRLRGESKHARRDRELGLKISAIHSESRGTYGSPRVYDELKVAKEKLSKKRVARIMREQGVSGKPPKRFQRTTDSAHKLPIADNLLQRNFIVDAPDKVWVSDITYVRTWEGWLYVAIVLDLFSRRVVGWAVADHMRTELVLDALNMAATIRRPAPGLIHHSDRGSQYASDAYRRRLADRRMLCSMSRKGDCWDNGVPRTPERWCSLRDGSFGLSGSGYRVWFQTTPSCCD
jgi:putative transposase